MSEYTERLVLEDRRVRVNALLTPTDRRIILDGRDGKSGDWIIQAITSPADVSVGSLRAAIEICERYILRRPRRARQVVPQRSFLRPASRKLAIQAAIAKVRTFDDDEVRQIAEGILRNITPQAVLEPEVARRLLSGSVDTQRQGLVLFAVDNDGIRLAEKQQQTDDLAEWREARAASIRGYSAESERIAAATAQALEDWNEFDALFPHNGVAASTS